MDWAAGFDASGVSGGVAIRATQPFRPLYGSNLTPGTVVKSVAMDFQQWSDGATVGPTFANAADKTVQGVVSQDWKGYTGADPATYAANQGLSSRGTQIVRVTAWGFHPAVLFDATAGTALTNGLPVVPSATTPGRAQGGAGSFGSMVGNVMAPQAGLGSNIANGALVQASATVTLTGVPNVAGGDSVLVTLQIPYLGSVFNPVLPGIPQTRLLTVVLTAAQSASLTTAAAAVAAAINADSILSVYYTATAALGVITIAVNALSSPFLVTYLLGGVYRFGLSGSAANGLTFTTSAVSTGSLVSTASAGTLTGGAGFFGTLPVFISLS